MAAPFQVRLTYVRGRRTPGEGIPFSAWEGEFCILSIPLPGSRPPLLATRIPWNVAVLGIWVVLGGVDDINSACFAQQSAYPASSLGNLGKGLG